MSKATNATYKNANANFKLPVLLKRLTEALTGWNFEVKKVEVRRGELVVDCACEFNPPWNEPLRGMVSAKEKVGVRTNKWKLSLARGLSNTEIAAVKEHVTNLLSGKAA